MKINQLISLYTSCRGNEKDLYGKEEYNSAELTLYVIGDQIVKKYSNYKKKNKNTLEKLGWKSLNNTDRLMQKNSMFVITSSETNNCIKLSSRLILKGKENNDKMLNEFKMLAKKIYSLSSGARLIADVSLSQKMVLKMSPNLYEEILKDMDFENSTLLQTNRRFRREKDINITDEICISKYSKYNDVEIKVKLENNKIENIDEIDQIIVKTKYYYFLDYIRNHYFVMKSIMPNFILANKDFYDKVACLV